VGCSSGSAVGRRASFEGNDRFGALAGFFHEARTIFDTFNVEGDTGGVFVLIQIGDQISEVEVCLVADGDHLVEANTAGIGDGIHGDQQRTALGDQGGLAREGQEGGKRGIQFIRVGKRTHDIGSQDTHAILVRNVHQFIFKILAADLAEARGDHAQGLDAFFAAFFRHLRHKFHRHRDNCQVHFARHVGNRRENLQTEDFGSSGVDGIDLAIVTTLKQILNHCIADLPRLGRGPNHGHSFGLQEIV